MPLVSKSAYAAQRGVTLQAVSKAVKRGRISTVIDPVDGKQKIDPEVADREWTANTRALPTARIEDEAPAPRGEPERSAPTITDAEARLKDYKARMAQLDYEERSGQLEDAEKVKRTAFIVGRSVRDALQNIPAKVSAEFAGESDQFVIHRRLEDEIRMALEVLHAKISTIDEDGELPDEAEDE